MRIAALILMLASLQYAGAGEPVLVRDWTMQGSGKATSWGTAFGVGNGIAVTAAHVLKGGTLEVKTATGWAPAKVLATDADLDIAILSTTGRLDDYTLADKAVSTDTFTIEGFPQGERKTIKAKAKEEYGRKVILDARGMEHGFSGAPVVDGRGCVVGVAVAGLKADEGGDDMDHKRAVAVPLDALNALLLPYLRPTGTVPPVAVRVPGDTYSMRTPSPQTRSEPLPESRPHPALLAAFAADGRKWRAVRTPSGLVFERAESDALGGESWRKCAADYANEEWSRAAVTALADSK